MSRDERSDLLSWRTFASDGRPISATGPSSAIDAGAGAGAGYWEVASCALEPSTLSTGPLVSTEV
jgi:hypothetical protein